MPAGLPFPLLRRLRAGLALLPILALVLLLLAAGSPPASAQPFGGSPRGAVHEGFGRMVFDWDAPVAYSADVINGELVLRFDRPVKGDFRNLLRPLAKYLRSASVSADRKTATFPLARPVQVKAFAGNNNTVVVDLLDQDPSAPSSQAEAPPAPAPAPAATAAPPPAEGAPLPLLPPSGTASAQPAAPLPAAPLPVVPPAAPAAAPAAPPAPAPSRSAGPPTVEVRAGEHGTYNRLVFDWPQAVDYKVEQQGSRATISFARPGRLDFSGVAGNLGSDITLAPAEAGAGGGARVTLSLPPEARLRHFASGAKVVVDVVRAANAKAPAGAPATPLAPPPGADVAVPALQPLVPEEAAKLPSETLAGQSRASGPSPVKPIPQGKPASEANAKAVPAVPPPPAAAASPPAAPVPPAAAASHPSGPDKVFSLSVSWDKPVAAAVFQRAGYLWMVFDRGQTVDTKLLRRLGGEAVSAVDQLPSKDATILRLLVQPDYVPSVRRDGLLWIVDLTGQSPEPKEPIQVTAPAALPTGIGMTLGVADAGTVVLVRDPEVGDTMVVVPVMPLGAGIYPGRDTPDLELLPTIQGIAIVPYVDGLDIRSSRAGVTIGYPSGAGLRLSAEAGKPQLAKTEANGRLFDVVTWARGGSSDFQAERRIVEAGLVDLPPGRRATAHLQAARFFFANGYAAEALGYLRLAASDEPTLVDTAPFRALRGACETLMTHWDLAAADLDNPLLKDDPESQFWRAAALAGAAEDIGRQDKPMAAGLPFLREYPHRLKWPLASLAARAALAAADDEAAQDALDVLDREVPTANETAELDYLHGLYDELVGDFDKAQGDYDRAMSSDNREFHAKAGLAEVELDLKLHKIGPKEAADRLDHLRFSWREEDFEFQLLRRFAELQLDAGDYPAALRALRSLAVNYPNNKDAPKVSKMMTDTFAKLYLDGAADSMPPVSAIGLFDEFRELTPPGPKGDEMIRKLADRLAAVDLLDRAADLLKHQVAFRLQGLDKGRVGAQLALLDLLNRQPEAALDALQISEVPGLPADLVEQRKQMKARALADADRVPEAIQLLANDTTADAAQLRVEIHWRARNWLDAAADFETMVPRPDRGTTLDDGSARLVLSWATALTLGNDERGLAALRRNFGPAMAGTAYRDGFTLLTSALERDIPDLPAVATKIKEAEGFQSFMSNYRKRMQSAGLSRIN